MTPLRIAMWSGPRNLSTALMRSFGSREDCTVWDEPFYAAYLKATGLDHPLRAEIIAAGETDPAKVALRCSRSPDGTRVFYQKHMTQHMIASFPRDWMHEVCNIFLIRDPVQVVASYFAKRENPGFEEIGFELQAELFEQVMEMQGVPPPVVDSDDILANPRGVLFALCEKIGLEFSDTMLSWKAAPHPEDGVWAPHWYKSVWASSGFASPRTWAPEVPEIGRPLVEAAMPYYERLAAHRIVAV